MVRLMATVLACSIGRYGASRSTSGRTVRPVAASLLATAIAVAGFALTAATAGSASAAPRPGSTSGIKTSIANRGATRSNRQAQVKPPPPGPDVATGPDSLQLVSQTAWVDPSSTQFRLHLKITALNPSSEMLAVNVYTGLTTRSQFWGALGGEFYGSYYQPGGGPVPLTDLARDPNGGVDVDIPVNQSSGELSATGVYPVQIFLEEGGVPKGKALTSFIVYWGKDVSSFRLGVSFVLPMAGDVQIGPLGAPGPLSDAPAATFRGDAAALTRWHVPVTIQADDPTLRSLASGTSADRAAVTDLRQAIAAGDELLPASALPLNIQQLVGSGLTNDLSAQLSSGDADLGRLLGTQPPLTTWASNGSIDPTSMDALANLGVKEVAVPANDLSTLPLADQEFTFAQPTKLSVQGPDVLAVGADPELSARVGQAAAPGAAVLVANQFLAELAMIDLERPSDQRGVVVIPAPGVEVNPVFLSVVLAGLQGNPLVQAVDLQQLFKGVPLAPSTSGGPMVRQLTQPTRTVDQLAGVGQFQRALSDVAADGEVYGQGVGLVKQLDRRLFVSLSSTFDGSQRASIIKGVLRAADSALGNVRLPPSISITLTSRQGLLPLTLRSSATAPVRVQLVLTSDQLSFVAATFAEGSCAPGNAEKSSEKCQLTLSRSVTSLRIPVVVRAPGAFPLTLQIETPSGDMVLRSGTGSVTSTAISDVGWFLMVGAALFLGAWWVRNARHGRRARQLIPRPDDEPGPADDGPDAPGAAPEDGGTPHGPPATADATKAIPMANPTTPGRSGDVTIVTAGPADPRTSSSGASSSGAGNSVAARPDAGNPHLADADATNPGEAAPSAATSTATAASPRGPGAANPVGAGPGYVARSGRDAYLAKHVQRPPR